ncbi:peptidase [Shewanella baltica]|uniref:Rz-like lysis system protein LysB n=1 Tax=Shewanella baltica TaxID=62322 RepID=UPI00217E5178|nr:Rz-like lysis system protein LysB [Shewanella baltica]MCS6236211.1 peptidase [Shewanella baltica]MCS6270676.1 peptidase [Shewanella baltica]
MLSLLSRFIQPFAGYLIAAAIGIALTMAGVIYQQQERLNKLQQTQGAMLQSLTQTSQSYFDLKQLSAENQQAQAELRTQLASVNSTSQYRQNKIEELKRELSDIKAWADTLLPDAIRRLHQRPAISGSAEYRRWLSTRDPLSVAGEQSHQQSRDKQ